MPSKLSLRIRLPRHRQELSLWLMWKAFFVGYAVVASVVVAQTEVEIPVVNLATSVEFKQLIDEGLFDVIVDVRTRSEWDSGHIEGATFLENLNLFGTASQAATPADLMGCEYCTIGVYCASGRRAGIAIGILKNNGFRGRFFNGLGVTPWIQAGFPVVTTDSAVAPCQVDSSASEDCLLEWQSYLDALGGEDESPSLSPSVDLSTSPSLSLSMVPSTGPSETLSATPSETQALSPTDAPSLSLSMVPSTGPSESLSARPSEKQTLSPTDSPSLLISVFPSTGPSQAKTGSPSESSVADIPAVNLTSAAAFKQLIDEGFFDVIVDVRATSEWDNGHIEGATFLENLNLFGTASEGATPADLMGCEYCTIGVYCSSGRRAGTSIGILKRNGFRGRFYNGLGVSAWISAGFPLVTTDSATAPCQVNSSASEECLLAWQSYHEVGQTPTVSPSMLPEVSSSMGAASSGFALVVAGLLVVA